MFGYATEDKSLASSSLQKNYSSDHSDFNAKDTFVKNISMFNDVEI